LSHRAIGWLDSNWCGWVRITGKILQLLNRRFLMFRGWMNVSHSHLNVGVAGKLAQSGEINACHSHAG